MEKKIYLCYKNGEYIDADKVAVSPWDLGFLRGYGVFDVLPVINEKAFLWEWHYERLLRSATELGLTLPVTKEAYGEILQELIKRNKGHDIIFRTVITGGVSEDAFTPVANNETLLVLTEEFQRIPEAMLVSGATVMTQDHVRFFPQVKMTHYVSAIKLLKKRKELGALETLYVQEGIVSECAQSNFFIVKNGVVITTNENALLGITQKLLIEKLAPENDIKIEVRKMTMQEVLASDEAFLTGSNKGVVPIVRIDDVVIGDGNPGSLTKLLVEKYQEYIKNY